MKMFTVFFVIASVLLSGCVIFGPTPGDDPIPPQLDPPPVEPPLEFNNETGDWEEQNATENESIGANTSSEWEDILNRTTNQSAEDSITGQKYLNMLFLDVGYGDATLIKAGDKVILVDTGSDGQTVMSKLELLGITQIDLLIISSWDDQKTGGVKSIIRDLNVDEVWSSRKVPANFAYESIRDYIDRQEILVLYPKSGDKYAYGDIVLDVYNPQEEEYLDNADANSIVTRVSFGDFCAFLPSDLENAMEQPVVGILDKRTCAVYKWRNNGEGRPDPSVLYDRVSPSDVIISVGPNDKKLPSSTTIQRLGISRAGIYRTDIDGDIYINASRSGFHTVETGRDLEELGAEWN